jgi:uncharacterized protein (TIGR03437 family)
MPSMAPVRDASLLCVVLLSVPAMASTSGLVLGVDYTTSGNPNILQIATDISGNLYELSNSAGLGSPSLVTKLASDGKTIVWQQGLAFSVGRMAVDPNGDVYLVPSIPSGKPFTIFVEKLAADGSGIRWQTQTGFAVSAMASNVVVNVAVDSVGRAFVSGYDDVAGQGYVARLNPSGVVDYTTTVNGQPWVLAVDGSGSHVVVGISGMGNSAVLGWLTPGGTATTYSPVPIVDVFTALAIAPNGDAVVMGASGQQFLLFRVAPGGATIFSTMVAEAAAMGVDGNGNAFVAAYAGSLLHPIRNTLAPCGPTWLSVFAPDGSLIQNTYLPIPPNNLDLGTSTMIAVTPSSIVFVDSLGGTAEENVVVRLSPNAHAQLLPLACIGNAASYLAGPIAPGEIVTLFGNSLGPQQGIEAEITPQTPFPTQLGKVAVTFNGTPGPLLWVQDAQINVEVPWSLSGQTAQVCVSYNDINTNCLSVPVAQAAPGVFTVDGIYAAALNQDGTYNSKSNPAKAGSVVSVFATGLGPINPPQADGSWPASPLPVNTLPLALSYLCPGVQSCGSPFKYDVSSYGPVEFMPAAIGQIQFRATSSPLFLFVSTSSTTTGSNSFKVYVVNQ